jgi:hypothetical protein
VHVEQLGPITLNRLAKAMVAERVNDFDTSWIGI